jgi:S1-C subfamily serine protease
MIDRRTALIQLSDAFAARAAEALHLTAAVRISSHRTLSGILWQSDALVTSEQSLPARDAYEVILPGGQTVQARGAGRDPGTNLAVLEVEGASASPASYAAAVRVGELALAYGADASGSARARVGFVNAVGPEWHSRAGGRIDSRILLDIELARSEEGGPVLNATGELIGMSAYGNRGEVLVIPARTIERVVPALLREGHVARGWLGLALQPVAVPNALRDVAGLASGMMVMSVADNGPGARAGITAGDIVVSINGVAAVRMDKVAAQLDADSIGQTAELRLIRGGAVMPVRLVIAARPSS